jgi:hypothetical protein
MSSPDMAEVKLSRLVKMYPETNKFIKPTKMLEAMIVIRPTIGTVSLPRPPANQPPMWMAKAATNNPIRTSPAK